MGGACCVASRDRSIVNASGSEGFRQNIRHSPSWSVRWENRGRVAGEDTSITCFSDGISRTGGSETKLDSLCASEDRSPLESFEKPTSPASQGTTMSARTPASDESILRNVSMDASLDQVKDIEESPAVLNPSPTRLSVSLPSTSSLPTSPFSSESHQHPATLTMSRWHLFIGKGSENQSPELKSSSSLPVTRVKRAISSWSNEPTRGSHGGSSDGWSMQMSPELLVASHRERRSFDDEYINFNSEISASNNGQVSVSSSVDLQVCGICTKLLADRSFWSSQKLVASNELPVVAVLICGHFYHAECLETMTPEISKYDPSCPICTLGEKQTLKLFQKAIKAELEMKGKHKRSKNRVVEGDFDGDPFEFYGLKGHGGRDVEDPKMASSSRMRKSLAKPFLRRHFSVGSKSQTTKRKAFFWTRSIKG